MLVLLYFIDICFNTSFGSFLCYLRYYNIESKNFRIPDREKNITSSRVAKKSFLSGTQTAVFIHFVLLPFCKYPLLVFSKKKRKFPHDIRKKDSRIFGI